MSGDTGIAINPGPITEHEFNDSDVSGIDLNDFDPDMYLNDIDPDSNYFNETEFSSSYFKSYTIDEFKERNFNSQLNLNILHHNSRSIMSKDKLDHYEYFFRYAP